MRRFFLMLITLLFAFGAVYLLAFHARKEGEPLELVPQNAVLMLDWADAARSIRGITRSPFGQRLKAINWQSVMEQLGVPILLREHLQEEKDAFSRFFAHPLFRELSSRRIIVALLPLDKEGLEKDTLKELEENLLILVSTGSKIAPSRFVSLLKAGEEGVESLVYKDVQFNVIELDHRRKLYVSFVDGQLLISLSMKPLQHTVDLSLERLVRQQTGFVLNSNYLELKDRAQRQDDFFLFADLAQLRPLFRVIRSAEPTGTIRKLSEIAGTERMAFFHRSDRNTQRFTSIVQFNPDGLPLFQKTIYTREPVQNPELLSMPSDLLLYFWSNWLDLNGWWKRNLTGSTEKELAAAERITAWIEQQTGMSLSSFLNLFGQEFSITVSDIITSGFFPVPRIYCSIEVTDPDRIRGLMEKMLAGLPVRRDKVGEVPVVSLMAADGLMQPSYSLQDHFLVLADSREQIEDIIKNDSKRLTQDDVFQAVDLEMQQPSNLIFFGRTADLIAGIKEFVSWAGTIIAIRDPVAGGKSKVMIDQVILPLLDGLKMFRAKGVRSYTAPGEVVLEAAVLVEAPGQGDFAESGLAE